MRTLEDIGLSRSVSVIPSLNNPTLVNTLRHVSGQWEVSNNQINKILAHEACGKISNLVYLINFIVESHEQIVTGILTDDHLFGHCEI